MIDREPPTELTVRYPEGLGPYRTVRVYLDREESDRDPRVYREAGRREGGVEVWPSKIKTRTNGHARDKCCAACGQTIPEPLSVGVKLSPIRTRIFEAVRRAGAGGICRDDLMDVVYGNAADGGPGSANVIAAHVAQINKLLAPLGRRIASDRGRGSGTYTLRSLKENTT